MKKIFLSIVILLNISISWSQRSQTIAYIDMEYILENVPEYLEAQNTLDEKVIKWRQKLDKESRHIELLKTDLANEKAILTKDLIEEKEEEIALKQDELRRLESLYFGPRGDMFLLRKQLVKPIQDQVYNAIQSISARKKYDFVFNKSSDLIMLYSNKKYDISELILATMDRSRLIDGKNAKREERKNAIKELTDKQKQAIAKKDLAVAKKISEKEAKKKALLERRNELLQKREEKRELLRKKKEALRKKKEDQKQEQEKQEKNNN